MNTDINNIIVKNVNPNSSFNGLFVNILDNQILIGSITNTFTKFVPNGYKYTDPTKTIYYFTKDEQEYLKLKFL